MKLIKLTKGIAAIVDDDDFEHLSQWNWYLSEAGYAHRNQHIRLGKNKYASKTVRMHRAINDTPDGLVTDHINRNKLDNRRCNLRTATKSLNSINRSVPANNRSGHKGVYWDSWSKKWRAEIKLNYKKISLGRFSDIQQAVEARVDGERKYYAV